MKKIKFPGFVKRYNEEALASFSAAGKIADEMYLHREKERDILTIYFRDGSVLEVKAKDSNLEVTSEIMESREKLEKHYGGSGFVFIEGVGEEE